MIERKTCITQNLCKFYTIYNHRTKFCPLNINILFYFCIRFSHFQWGNFIDSFVYKLSEKSTNCKVMELWFPCKRYQVHHFPTSVLLKATCEDKQVTSIYDINVTSILYMLVPFHLIETKSTTVHSYITHLFFSVTKFY